MDLGIIPDPERCAGIQIGHRTHTGKKAMLDHRISHLPAHALVIFSVGRQAAEVCDQSGDLKRAGLVVMLPGWDEKYIDQSVDQGNR